MTVLQLPYPKRDVIYQVDLMISGLGHPRRATTTFWHPLPRSYAICMVGTSGPGAPAPAETGRAADGEAEDGEANDRVTAMMTPSVKRLVVVQPLSVWMLGLAHLLPPLCFIKKS